MGRSSRDRRRQRDRRLQAAERARERRRAESEEVGRQELDAVEIERLFMAAVDAHRRRDKDEMWEAVDALTGPPGYGLRADADARILERVRALLAKAESTTFPEEAEALSAKAQELMARYAIDRALLGGVGDGPHGVGGRRIHIDDPYARSKFLLVDVVADA